MESIIPDAYKKKLKNSKHIIDTHMSCTPLQINSKMGEKNIFLYRVLPKQNLLSVCTFATQTKFCNIKQDYLR